MAILCSSSNTRVAVALCLLLIFWGCFSDHLISTFLTLCLLVLSPSAVFVIRRIGKAETESPSAGSEVAWLESEGSECEITSTAACMGTTGSPEEACHSTESSEDLISDDENLIEISLPDGHFVAREEPKALLKPLPLSNGCLPNPPLQDSVRQHGLTELLLEINEEDNLIEIDIIKGSIKCARVGIKA